MHKGGFLLNWKQFKIYKQKPLFSSWIKVTFYLAEVNDYIKDVITALAIPTQPTTQKSAKNSHAHTLRQAVSAISCSGLGSVFSATLFGRNKHLRQRGFCIHFLSTMSSEQEMFPFSCKSPVSPSMQPKEGSLYLQWTPSPRQWDGECQQEICWFWSAEEIRAHHAWLDAHL